MGVINQGTISADVAGGTITINAQPFTNSGLVESPVGTLTVAGTLATGGLGNFQSSGGLLGISGVLTNTGQTLTLNGQANVLRLQGGAILGGSVTTSGGASLIVQSGTLNGVTVNGVLDVGNSVYGASLTVISNFVLNGTCYVGNPTNNSYGTVSFSGSQTLSGNGFVVFGDSGLNNLSLANGGTTLTIDGGITVRGQNGQVGAAGYPLYTPANVGVINQGTISADVAGGTILIQGSSFQNSGIIWAAGGALTLPSNFQSTGTLEASDGGVLNVPLLPSTVGNVTARAGGKVIIPNTVYFNGLNRLSSELGGSVAVSGSVLGNTKNIGQFSPTGTLILNGSGTAALPQLLEVMGTDLGSSPVGFIHNFNYGILELANNTYVELVDQFHNSTGTGREALYVNSLIVPAGSALNLNGLHVYARATQIGGNIVGGSVTQIPNSGPIGFGQTTLGNLATAGELDQWTFFARAGQAYTILVDPGSDIGTAPYLGNVTVRVTDTNGTVFASTTNSNSGTPALLAGVGTPHDGSYNVQVQAASSAPASTGYYNVTIWQSTPNIRPLPMEQIVNGSIQTPYGLDQWTFAATANTEINFHLINTSGTGVAFDLTGPIGPLGFTNLVADSGFVVLPSSGTYTITAHSLNGQYGSAYAFEVSEIVEAKLALGTTYQGQWVGTGQGTTFEFNVPIAGPMQVVLNNLITNNHAEVYVAFGQPPTISHSTYSSTTPSSPTQQVLIPLAAAGTWYILVYGDNIQTPGGFTVAAASAAVLLSSVTPNRSGITAPATFTLSGAGFDSSSSVKFVGNGTNFPATSVSVDSFTQITVLEAAGALPPGTYSVQISLGTGASATLTNALQVLGTGAAQIKTSLTLPNAIGFHAPSTIYSHLGNVGDAATPAPLIVLTATGNEREGAFLTQNPNLVAQGLWTSADPAGFGHSVQFLGSGQTPGSLLPGESLTVPTYYAGWQQPWGFSSATWTLGVIQTDDPTPIDWTSFKSSMRPPSIPTEAWDAIWTVFTREVGNTWGGYVTSLDNNCAYLGRLQLNVTDLNRLLAFQLMQADGLSPLRTLASSVDASVPVPGLPLSFSRSFGEPISQRYAIGPFGRGWSHNWQYSLQVGSDGTMTIYGPGASQRVFQPDTRNGGFFAQAGDYGVLARAGSGYSLTEKSGLQYIYQGDGTLGSIVDLNHNSITLGYSSGLLSSLTHSSGQSIQLTYNRANLIQTITDNFGRQTSLTYDPANQHLIGAQYFDGRVATYTYNTSGPITQLHALTAVASSCCNWRYFTYDDLGRLTGTYLAENAEALSLGYGLGGQVNVTNALGNVTQFYYDHRGLPAKTQDALGNAVHLSFDDNYNLVSVVDPVGRSYSYSYDQMGNVVGNTDPLANTTQFTFTSDFDRLASLTDARGNPTKYGYDPSGNLQSIRYADGSVETWSYDSAGNPETWTNRRGHQALYTFNGNGQVTAKYFADGSVTSFGYDAQGNLTNASTFDTQLNPLESSTMSYDTNNRLSQITYPGGKFLSFTYDQNGRRTSSLDQLGHRLEYFYDLAGRLTAMTNEANALVVQYQYDPAGRVAIKTLGNGMFTTYQYDPVGQLLSLSNLLADNTLLSTFAYTYDSRGRRTSMTSLDGHWTYGYDDLGQLTHAVLATATTNIANQDLTYIYDALGNRSKTIENGVTNIYTANSLNQYVTIGSTQYKFDADGNLIQETSPTGITTYEYNDENRLVSVTSPHGLWQYIHDALGSRTIRNENGRETRDVIDPVGLGNVVGEYDSTGKLVIRYDYAVGLLSRLDVADVWGGFAFDGAGNVAQIVSEGGVAFDSYSYEPFGASMSRNESISNSFQFVGQKGVRNDYNGVQFMRAREFSTATGRFLSSDPLGLGGGDVNLYRYAFNTPVIASDASGLSTCEWAVDIGGSALGVLIGVAVPASWPGILRVGIIPFASGIVIGAPPISHWICDDLFAPPGPVLPGPVPLPLNYYSPQSYWAYPHHYYPVGNPPNPCLANPPVGSCGNGGNGTMGTNGVTHTQDPNLLTGPSGYGPNGFLSSSSTLAYRIDFENETNATAPAQQVIISDQLSTNFDWRTFTVTEVGFGDMILPVSAVSASFITNVPLNYLGTNFQLQVQVGINPSSGLVLATFRSIDPNTSLPPPVNIGFIPPEDGTGRGEGHITYTIRARTGLPTGIQLTNVALISFDNAPSISTDQIDDNNPAAGVDPHKQALITLDSVAPSSHVLPLQPQTQVLAFPVSWTAQDDLGGSGVASYDVYLSDNTGPWTLWLTATPNNTAMFQGQPHHRYGFYSIAHDNAGNIEAPKTISETTTTVVANPQLLLSVSPGTTNVNVGDLFEYTIAVTNIGSLSLANVGMSNAIPDGLFVDEVTYGRGSSDVEDTFVNWSLGNLNTGRGAIMTVTAVAATNGVWTNLFRVSDAQGVATTTAIQVITVGSPELLSIVLTDQGVVLSWPSTSPSAALQTSRNLFGSPTWTPVTNAPTILNSRSTVVLPVTGSTQFFRLRGL